MFPISYAAAATFTAAAFLLTRLICFSQQKAFSLLREAALLPVLIALLVVLRFTFFPFDKVDGRIQPLVFDAARLLPFRINLIPFNNLFDYPERRQVLLNIIGNTAMFVPIGVIWPAVYRKLDSHKKAIAAGDLDLAAKKGKTAKTMWIISAVLLGLAILLGLVFVLIGSLGNSSALTDAVNQIMSELN